MTDTIESGMAAIIAETEAAIAKENDTIPAQEETISSSGGEDTLGSAGGEETTPSTSEDTIEGSGADIVPAAKEPEKKKPWFMNKIDRENERRRAAEENARILAEENAALKKLANVTEPEKDVKEQIRLEIRKELQQENYIKAFDKKCDETAAIGREKYGDFDDAVKMLHTVGLATNQFLDLVTDLKASHEILYELGKNPEEAEKLLNLPPAKQALELGRMEAKFTKPIEQKQVSKAPAPPKIPAGSSSSAGYTGDDPEKLLSSEDGITKYFDKKFNRK